MFCFNIDCFVVTIHSVNIAWIQVNIVFANCWRDFQQPHSWVYYLSLMRKKCNILHYVTVHCDFQECNPNIKQGCTVVKFVSIKIKS